MAIKEAVQPSQRDEHEVLFDKNGFAVVLVSEVIHQTKHFLLAESLGKFPHGGTYTDDGWRIYYAEKDPALHIACQLDSTLTSTSWFALHTKGPDVVGVYFPQVIYDEKNRAKFSELLDAIDAYFKSTDAMVIVPNEKFFNLTQQKQNVRNPYSGRPEFCIDLVMNGRGRAHINGMRIRSAVEEKSPRIMEKKLPKR